MFICLRFDLQKKIVATVTDNGSDMRAAVGKCSIFGSRIHCKAHALNLIVQNSLGLWPKKKKKAEETVLDVDT